MNRSLLWTFLQSIFRIGLRIWFDVKVYGKKNVPRAGGVLLASNHESALDPILVAIELDRPVSYMAKSELFEYPIFGEMIRRLHAFPVRQGEGDVGAIRETIRRLKEGHVLNIFPEGSRTLTGELQPIEPGVTLVIRRAGVPVVPVAITGSFEAWPKSRRFFRAYPIRVMYGEPMHLSDLPPEQIVQRLEEALRRMLDELHEKERVAD